MSYFGSGDIIELIGTQYGECLLVAFSVRGHTSGTGAFA